MNYEKKIKMRITQAVLVLILGFIALSFNFFSKTEYGHTTISAAYLFGTGSVLILNALLILITNSIALKNKDKQKAM